MLYRLSYIYYVKIQKIRGVSRCLDCSCATAGCGRADQSRGLWTCRVVLARGRRLRSSKKQQNAVSRLLHPCAGALASCIAAGREDPRRCRFVSLKYVEEVSRLMDLRLSCAESCDEECVQEVKIGEMKAALQRSKCSSVSRRA